MRCPKCKRYMEKIVNSQYLNEGVYFYKCSHCNYISDLMTNNNKPFGEKYELPAGNKDLEEWILKKKYVSMGKLKVEHKEIVKQMQKKYGKLTADDKYNLLIDIYLYNKNIEEN